jgi:hypothetical protein
MDGVSVMLAIVLALKLPTLLILAWALQRPEEAFRPGRRYWGVLAIAVVHVFLALLSLTGEKSSLSELFVAYPLIWSVLLRDRLRGLLPSPASIWLMAVVICVLLWFEETWVIVDHHSPPWRHYVHYFGFYAGVTATILWLYCRYHYTALQTFVVGGLWGVLVEQNFAGPKMLLSGAVVQALGFGLYIFPVYGLYRAAPRLLFFEESSRSIRTSRWQGLWLFLGIAVLPLVAWALWSMILQAVGFDRSGVP